MAFFSFSLLEDSFCFVSEHLEANLTYYSKDITLWKELNNKKKKIQLNSIKYEKRVKIDTLGKKLLICLPPKFGLGDAIEYSVAINSINKSKKFSKVGIAFCSNHTFVFKTIFSFHNIYPVCISSNEISKYDTIFHITLELNSLKFQKYNRSDIALEICKYFNVPIANFRIKKKFTKNFLKKKISIFPISTSVIRSMPHNVIDSIKKNFENSYDIEIFLDHSNYSSQLQAKYIKSNIVIKKPDNVQKLIKEISKISFGIFIDSGPLHVAKIFDKRGVFVETSVSNKILLSNSSNIEPVKNKYKSEYCNGPCGLVDIFYYQKNFGCYETNKFSFKKIKKLQNLKNLQRRNKNENNSHFILNPVGCVEKIDIENVIKAINIKLKEQ